MGKQKVKPNYRRRVLRLPDLDHCKAPFLGQSVVKPGRRHLGKKLQMHGRHLGAIAREPGLLGGEAQHGREPSDRATEQMIEHGQAGLAFHRGDRVAIKRVLADVEIEGRQVRGQTQ